MVVTAVVSLPRLAGGSTEEQWARRFLWRALASSGASVQLAPPRRLARSSDIAEMLRFVIGPKSAYITGRNILIDGGWTIY